MSARAHANLILLGCAPARHIDWARARRNVRAGSLPSARMANRPWRTGAYGELAMANWHMANRYMGKRRFTIPNKKTINTALIIDEKAELYIQKCELNFLANLKRIKMLTPKPKIGGNENHNGSLLIVRGNEKQ